MKKKPKENRPYDPKLLDQPWEEQLEYFAKFKVAHTRLEEVAEKVIGAVLHPNDKNFVFMVGPPRAGKTTVQIHIIYRLLQEFRPEMTKNPGFIPVIWLESSAYPHSYNWKDHWTTCLRALSEPLIDHKTLHPADRRHVTAELRIADDVKGAAAAWRHSFLTAALERKLRVLINDEAHHMRKAPTKTRIIDHAEILKSDASKSKAVFLLCGTYDLLDLANLNGQLGCRTEIVHFSRYRADSNKDLESFGSTVLTLVDHMPLREPPDMTPHLNYCYEISLGCVGLLKMWFYQALKDVLKKKERTLTINHLKRHEPPIDVRLEVAREIYRGEEKLKQDNSKEERIRRYMGLGVKNHQETKNDQESPAGETMKVEDPGSNEAADTDGDNGDSAVTNRRKRISKPGERKPKRDKVGEGRKKCAA